ncbi:MAG: hypothetical protein ACT4TC_14535 [Myxococcaceae bacterium]
MRVVLVTGRPAGWGEGWARTLPAAGVITENGGVFVYFGGSLNDVPLFGALRLSVGVSNERPVLDEIAFAPAFVTESAEERGFEEVAEAVLKGKR